MELAEVTEIEDRYAGVGGKPSLGDAYAALRERFDGGHRDRETYLRLMFLAWYTCSEPGVLTGLTAEPADAFRVFGDAFSALGGEEATDPEVLFTTGLMASLFPYCCGTETVWTPIGDRLMERYELVPVASKLTESVFGGRGAYGRYFARMLRHRETGSPT
jgi:hypothetical protein